MDQEQVERAINFILDQHAKFAAGLEDFRHAFAQREAEVDGRLNRITAVQETQAGMITNIGLHLGQLAGIVDKLSTKVDHLTERVDALAEMQRHTDGRLNIVISQVDDLIRRMGKPQ